MTSVKILKSLFWPDIYKKKIATSMPLQNDILHYERFVLFLIFLILLNKGKLKILENIISTYFYEISIIMLCRNK